MYLKKILPALSSTSAITAPAPWYLSGLLSDVTYLAVYQAVGAASAAAALVNLVNPGTYDLTQLADNSGGWNASYGLRNRIYSTGITLVAGLGVMLRYANAPVDVYVLGSDQPNYACAAVVNRTTSTRFTVYYSNGVQSVDTGALAAGTVAVNNRYAYRNGAQYGTQFSELPGSGRVMYIGGTNAGASWLPNLPVIDIMAAAFWSGNLTDDQVAAMHAAMAAL